MGYEPLVSIITLAYNIEPYIAECIESVLCQTYPNWEMIIVDDASTDGTPLIVEKYAKRDRRIKLIRNVQNNGPLYLDVNCNTALKEAQGDWIACLDGDDVFTKRSLEHRIKALGELSPQEREDIALVYGNCVYIWMDSGALEFFPNSCEGFRDSLYNDPLGSALKLFLQGGRFHPRWFGDD